MSKYLHPGPHPDADSLSAFVEGVVPEHERQQCVAHLADCASCREVVFLAQEPQPVSGAVPTLASLRRAWFAPLPVLGAAIAAGVIVAVVWIYLHRTPDMLPPHEMAIQPVVVAPPIVREQAQAPPPSVTPGGKRETHRAIRPEVWPANMLPPPIAEEQPSLPPPPPLPNQEVAPPPAFASSAPNAPAPPAKELLSGITGTVSDPSGAVIPHAIVALRPLAGTSSANAETDVNGKFNMTGLPAGRYEVRITAPGFQQTVLRVDLPPQEVAVLTPTLSVGSSAEMVEVTSSAATIESTPRPLPSKLPTDSTIASGKLMLALDLDGALFLSRNKGKSWKAVKPVWQGKVVDLSEPDAPSKAKFQITTDTGAEWLSQDGTHWYPAPAQR
jgi:hypothetical protein